MASRRRVVALAVRIDPQAGNGRLGLCRVRIQRAMSRPDVYCGRAHDVVTLRLHVGIVRAEHEVFAACALVRTGLPGIRERALPEVHDTAGHRAGRDFHHEWARVLHVWKRHDVRGRGVGRQQPELVLERQVIHVIEISRAEFVALFALPLHHRDERQPPQVRLAGALEIDVVVKLLDRGFGREAVIELELSEARIDRAGGRQLLRPCGGGRQPATSVAASMLLRKDGLHGLRALVGDLVSPGLLCSRVKRSESENHSKIRQSRFPDHKHSI